MCISLSGCSLTEVNITEITNSRLLPIETETDLYYDKDTKIVYIIFNERIGYNGFGYMSPYYADNGQVYRYDTVNKELQTIQIEE
jgi:hypothetical protein